MTLAWLAVAFILGVLVGAREAVPVPLAVALAAALVAMFILLRDRWGRFWLLILAALCLGLSRAPSPQGPPSAGDLRYYNGRTVALHGVISAEPDVRDTGINYVVAVDQITVDGRTRPVSGRLELRTARSQQLDYPDSVSLQGKLLTPQNVSALPYHDILAARGIYSQMRYPRVIDLGAASSGWLGWLVPLREHLERNIDSWLPEPEAALLIAITLGARSASLGDLAPVLVATGLIHIIAISGIKVALVAGTLYQTARLLRSRLIALLAPLAVVFVYVLLTGATASGERSALMWTMFFVAAYLGRPTVAVVSLSFVAALMVGFDPSIPWDIGFQLSTVGTFSIVAFAGPFGQKLKYLLSPFREALSVTVAAQVGTLPIVVVGFHVVSLTGALANALVLPLLPVLIVVGFLLGFCGGLTVLASPVAAFTYALLRAIIWLSHQLAAVPGNVPVEALSPWLSGLYYLLLGGLAVFVLRRAKWAPVGRWPERMREVSLALVAGASALTVSLTYAHDQPHARLYWLGTGQAMVLRTQGMTVLIDGSPQPFVLLERLEQVLPYTTRTIDLVVVTDPRSQNVVGLESVLAHYGISEVLDVGAEYPSGTYATWRAQLRARHIPVYALRSGASAQVGAVRLLGLGPDAVYPNPRDCIGMLRLATLQHSVLLAGASSRREQQEALFRPVSLRADVLMIGDGRSAVRGFLRAVHADRVLITSVKHPPGRLRGSTPVGPFSFDLQR